MRIPRLKTSTAVPPHSPQQRRPQGVPPVTPACGVQARFLGSAKPSLQSVVVIFAR
jgi:hypothetical protein